MKLFSIIIFIIFSIGSIAAQVGGYGTYKFLSLAPTARMTAMGDHVISIKDEDIGMAIENPALLNEEMIKGISISHKFLFSGISSGYASYGFKIGKLNMPFHAGLQYVSYGESDMTDEYGDKFGKISGSEYAFVLGSSYRVYDKLTVGLNTKFIYSNLANYTSTGLSIDIAAMYYIPYKMITAGFVIKNLGGQLSAYSDTQEFATVNVMFGISKRLEHLPFRLSITATHLNRWNLLYDNPDGENNILILGESQDRSKFSEFSDNLFRHINFAGEFMLGKNGGPFRLRFGYNYKKSREMTVSTYRSFAGFSFGFGIRIKKIRFDYAY
ncbi:MAG TPA: type IX secretion system protein PorQ, partial [Saprospiraceae bacterium]|nr:type IX secretion system protein PorQ [Saprospiraceae bacterium]